MNDYVKRIRTEDGDKQIDYKSLANLPTVDQEYKAESNNAQSGVAVAAAISAAIGEALEADY